MANSLAVALATSLTSTPSHFTTTASEVQLCACLARLLLPSSTTSSAASPLSLETAPLSQLPAALGASWRASFAAPLARFSLQALPEREYMALVAHVFERRYGWSEAVDLSVSAGLTSTSTFAERKAALNSALDAVLRVLADEPVSPRLVSALSATVEGTSRPVVREQTFRFFFDWLKSHIPDESLSGHFAIVRPLILSAITDVWSAIRKKSSHKLFGLAPLMPREHVAQLFSDLAALCTLEAPWQQVEGALLGLTVLVKSFSPTTDLPAYVRDPLPPLLFCMLAHAQMSVREHATRAFAALLSRCDIACDMFTQLVSRLDAELGDFEADGLLSVTAIVVDQLPPQMLLNTWRDYYSIFERYLAHPASTVRQKTSTIFLRLATPHPLLARLITQSLASSAALQPGSLDLAPPISTIVQTSLPPPLAPTSQPPTPHPWEPMEGRLLAYELILEHLYATRPPPRSRSKSTPTKPRPATPGSPKPSPARLNAYRFPAFKLEHLRSREDDDLVPFDNVLRQMLAQTVACSYDARWELRRMADQVLPHLVRVMCLYDASLFSDVWKHLSSASASPAQHCEALLSFKYVARAVPDHADLSVVPAVHALATSTQFDRLATLAWEVLVFVHASTELEPSHAHFEFIHDHLALVHGKLRQRNAAALRVLQWMLSRTHELLPALIANTPLAELLPIAPYWLHSHQDTDIRASMLSAVALLLEKCIKQGEHPVAFANQCVNVCLHTLDSPYEQTALHILELVCRLTDQHHLPAILEAIAKLATVRNGGRTLFARETQFLHPHAETQLTTSRPMSAGPGARAASNSQSSEPSSAATRPLRIFNKRGSLPESMAARRGFDLATPMLLTIRSNDICPSPMPATPDIAEDASPILAEENGGGDAGHSGDDWDDWDEDESDDEQDGAENLVPTFGGFLHRMREAGQDAFGRCLATLEPADRSAIVWLMTRTRTQ